jgi:prophage DNA circulation protein
MGNFLGLELDCFFCAPDRKPSASLLQIKNNNKPISVSQDVAIAPSTPTKSISTTSSPDGTNPTKSISTTSSSEGTNPQEDNSFNTPKRIKSGMELLDVLSDSAYKQRSLKSAHLDDMYFANLISDEDYASKMKALNLSFASGIDQDDSEVV